MVNRNYPTSFLLHCTVLLHILAAVKSGLLQLRYGTTIASYFDNVTALIKQQSVSNEELLLAVITWLCLTRSGNYQMHEFDWLKWILTAV